MLQRPFNADTFISDRNSFARFRADAATLPEGDRSRAFVRLVQAHLRTSPVYRNILDPDAIWINAEVPLGVRRKLKLPDAGVDLVARTKDGEFWAVRTAFVQPGDAVSVRQIAAFEALAHRTCRHVSHALVVHTAADVIPGLDKHTGQIALSTWSSLGQAEWRRIRDAAMGLRRKRPKAKKARLHQVKAVNDARKHYRKHARGRLVMPCGTGKSFTGILIADALKAETIIVAAPSIGLIRQNLAGWAEQFDATGRTFDCLCVCSDQTVGAGDGDQTEEDASDLGVEVTTDIKDIVARLRRPRNRPLVVFTTYHSSPLLAEASRKARIVFDLGILDEAHKTVGATDRAFATLLDEKLIGIAKRVAMTATERVYRGEREDVLSMDDEDAYGICFHQLSFHEAIKQKLICDYKIVTFFIGETEIRKLIETRSSVHLDHEGKKAFTDANAMSLAAGVALKSAIRDYGVRHIISFHRSIKAADNFRIQQDNLNRFPKLGPAVTNLHISGKFSAGERTRILEEFAASEYGAVSNARCLTEGIDVPNTDCILFEGAKQSIIDITQAAGRALRNFPGKKFGYIIVPVIVPDGVSFDEFAQTTEFRRVAQTLTAMSTQDERIAVEFRDIASGKPPKGGITVIRGTAPASIGMEFSKFASAVRTKVWSTLGRVNRRPFEEARAYVRSLNLKDFYEWREFATSAKRPADIPAAPEHTYSDSGWLGYPDWIGKDWCRDWRSFEQARAYVHTLGLNGMVEWRGFAKSGKKPADVPAAPDRAYADSGWAGYSDWVGSKRRRGNYRPFEQARAYVHTLGLKGTKEWALFAKSSEMPPDIPTSANRIYAEQWKNWGDWLGTDVIADRDKVWRPFEQARSYARKLGLKSALEWREFAQSSRMPSDLPTVVERVYAEQGWKSWGDWLGTGRVHHRDWQPFEQARARVRKLGFKNRNEFAKSKRRPRDIPTNPRQVYADSGWKGWTDWLGERPGREWRAFEKARAHVRKLGIKNTKGWHAYAKSKRKPHDIPSHPGMIYAGSGWQGMPDWLGTAAE